jgi:eukaryotic-like serine/threonine-protein kinase
VENTVKFKKIKIFGLVSLLVTAILMLAIFGFSCVSGVAAVGWSGGVVANNTLYVGSIEGRLAAVNLVDESRQWAEPLKVQSQGGLFGCSSMLSCGGSTSRVPIYGTPVVSDNLVYVAGYNGKIYAYNTINLAQKWIYPRDTYLPSFVGGMVIDNNKLYIGCADSYVYCLDANTGDLLSSYQTGDKIWGTPVVADGTLYIGSFDKTLYALNADDLTLKWKYATEGSIIAKPLVKDGIVFVGSFDKNLYALDAATGALKWTFEGTNWFWTQPVIVNDMLYAGCLDGFIYVLNPATGATIKIFGKDDIAVISPFASQPVAVDNYIIFASQTGIVYRIDSTTQEIKQLAVLTGTITGPLVIYNGNIYFQTQDVAIQRIDIATGSLLPSISLISG